MIFFHTLRYKNILSTGNTFVELDLSKNPTTLIIGQNGSGKSTFLDALSFGLFGKPFRKINKPQLINSINDKNMVVQIDFSIGSKNYLIERGMKPNFFRIYENNILLNQDAASKDYQEILEKNILKLNHKSFCQIVVLGSSTFVPFMQLTPQQRREIIEDLLDIQIFSIMNVLLKEKVQKNKTDLQEMKYQLELIQEKIIVHKDMIKRIRKNNDDSIKEIENKIEDTKSKIDDYFKLIDEKMSQEDELKKSISDFHLVTKRKENVTGLIKTLRDKLKKLDSDVNFYHSNDNCPTCKQGIDHDFKNNTIQTKQNSIQETNNALDTLSANLTELENRLLTIDLVSSEIGRIQRKISEYNGHISSGNTYIKSMMKELESLKSKQVDDSQEVSKLDELKKEWKEKEKLREQLIVDKEILDVASVLLKDGGIKAKIIKQYVPVINKLINKYLSIMELPIGFELNENFDETIKSRFRDVFSYDSFSEGEKQKLDLAILFTWRAIAKMRNSSNTNLLIMDEIFDSSLDVNGIEQLLTIIQSISNENNIFIISHKESMMDKFTNIIRFEKHKDFSRIVT
jgi:DNA repair exonuclease SbcCD ATPase subunit